MSIVDLAANLVHLDPVARRLLRVEAAGDTTVAGTLAGIVAEDRQVLLERRDAAVADPGIDQYDADVRVIQADGDVRWLRLIGRPVRDPQGRAVQLQGLLRDVTDQIRAEQQRRETDERHIFLLEVSDAVRELADPAAIGRTIVALLARQLGVSAVGLVWIDEAAGELVLQCAHPGDHPLLRVGTRRKIHPPTLDLMADGSLLVIDDVAGDPRLEPEVRELIVGFGHRSLVLAPQRRDGQLVGLLSVADASPRRWSDHELALVAETVERLWSATGRAEAQRDGELRLGSIIDTAADCIVVIDERGRIQSANRAATTIFGYATAELIGRNVSMLMTEAESHHHDHYLDRYRETGQAAIIGIGREVEGRRRDGSTIPLDLAVTEWHDSHGKRFFTGILRDITQRRQQAEALARARRLEAVGQLAGGVAHDFNNLLTVIGGNLELAEERSGDERTRMLIGRALDAVRRGVTFNDRLLTLVQRQERPLQPLVLADHLHEISAMLDQLVGPGVELVTIPTPDLWPVLVDPGELDSALLNLAANGRDAMVEGGTLTIRAWNATLRSNDLPDPTARTGDYVVLSVNDTGTGMAPEVVQRATDPFFSTKTTSGGTGLGLVSVAAFAHSSGGLLNIDSTIGQGTTVTVYLPRAAPPVPSPPSSQTADSLVTACRRILVVDDDELVRETTVATVESLGYDVVAAGGGAEAITRLQDDHGIDLVLTDVVMPGSHNGYDLARWIGTHRPHVRVVLCSGRVSRRPAPDPELAALPFRPKPYTRHQLQQRLSALLAAGGDRAAGA